MAVTGDTDDVPAPAEDTAADTVPAPDVARAQTGRRPTTWYDRVDLWVGIGITLACALFVLAQFQPRLLVLNTTAAGGDTGAHVWFPAFLRDHLLPWRVTGWAPDFYAGFPAGQFYFPLPALLVLLLDLVVPYNVAFKVVTASGAVMLPVAAYLFGRGLRVPRPAPALFAVAATGFLFFKGGGDQTMVFDHRIMGGTATSTLAGEYSFTIALVFALLFLAALARALEVPPRRHGPLWLPAVLLACVATSHLVVAVFAAYAALVIWVTSRPLRTATRALAIGAVGVLLPAMWLFPLAATLGYTTDMRYEPVNGHAPYLDWLFLSEHWFLFPLVVVAIVAGIVHRRLATLRLVAITVVAGLTFCGWELLRDVFGKAPAWNLRLLPFWYLMLYVLAALGAAEFARLAGVYASRLIDGPPPRPAHADAPAAESDDDRIAWRAADEGDASATTVDQAEVARSARATASDDARRGTRIVAAALVAALLATVAIVRVDATLGYIPGWAKYNYSGYEGDNIAGLQAKQWPEYASFMATAEALPHREGEEMTRLLWEPTNDIGNYGTPLALMLLPYWTHGRVASMEGLYYEAAGTTAYHFLTAAPLTTTPSNPVRGLPYRSIADFDLGVRWMQLLGVQYYAATSTAAKEAAARNPDLTLVASVPDLDGVAPAGWSIYEVADSEIVVPLAYEPVVATGLHEAPNWKCRDQVRPPADTPGAAELSPWECLAVPWFDDPEALDRPLTDDGPPEWVRAPADDARDVPKEPVPEIDVSNVDIGRDTVSFDVSRTGVPVMVKVSAYPNWEATGAQGPYRATPNFMVVVPTSRHVELHYGTTPAERLGRAASLLGLVGLGLLVWWGVRTPNREPVGPNGGGGGPTGRRRRRVRWPILRPARRSPVDPVPGDPAAT